MPVSGYEEMVKPSVGQFSEYTAGIPIKKRRFPFILSSSQPTEDLPSLPTENELMQKGFSSPLRVSTVLNDGTASASSNASDVLASLNTCGIIGSSKTSVLNADGVAPSLNAGSFAASSNVSGVATSSIAGSVVASSNASVVAMSSSSMSVAASKHSGSISASSNSSGVAMSSTAIMLAAGSSAGSVAMSSTPISVAARLNVGSVVESSNASGVSMSSTSISVPATPTVSRAVESVNATSVAGSVSSFSDASEKSVLEKEKRSSDSVVQGNSNLLRVKLEDQIFTVYSRSLADIDSKGKIVDSVASDNILKKSVKSELDLVGHDSLTFNIGKDMYSQTNVDGKFGSQLPTVSGNPGLSLGSREYLPAMASRNNEQGFRNQGKTEPVSLNL